MLDILAISVPIYFAYPIIAQKHGHDAMAAAAAQFGTTIASFFTLISLLWVLKLANGR